MTICYDERGAKYELPKFVLSKPSNLARSSKSTPPRAMPVQESEMAPLEAPVIPSTQQETMER